jgi:hypothetical protein
MRKIIDIETLEVFGSLSELAEDLGCSTANICLSILRSCRCMGRRLEYLDEWIWWTDKEKEQWTRKNGIYFLRGKRF